MMVLIYVTTSNEEEAIKIGDLVVKERLAACSNVISNMKSTYWWEGNLENDNEAILILKTLEKNVENIFDLVSSVHSYDNPCILALPVLNVAEKYLEWIKDEID
ncbi:CutA-like protein [Methanobrevibacter arboriphilus JCM 13429 = DSM 1125]|uniref:CutA-like protein n=1 Tax=Methanobrevibacter arboriphilus JCM 13429 = DSM 1125 TaxID=1300164 RepID=A0A1V6N0T3_METAZ|nr:divalent-cation tolerance protein CutA [Methanobrevibacter arboriphilus]OQD58222.1 CutA-like protein [Methanobrevibacter arboriphilus JCM 13429 = DSM 1125]